MQLAAKESACAYQVEVHARAPPHAHTKLKFLPVYVLPITYYTGTMTGLTPIPPASSAASRVARVVAEFTGFGRVKVALSMRGA